MHIPSISHTSFPSQCSEHEQHHEQELSKTLPNAEHFPDAPPTPLPPSKAQACPILAVGSELKGAPAPHLANQQSPGKPETSHSGAGEQQTQQAKGKSCKLQSPTNKKQEHFTLHPHIHHPGNPVQFLGLCCACTPQDADPFPVTMRSAKSSQVFQNI